MKNFLASLFAVDRPALRVVVFGAVGGALGVLAGGVAGELTARWYWLLAAPVLGAEAAFSCATTSSTPSTRGLATSPKT